MPRPWRPVEQPNADAGEGAPSLGLIEDWSWGGAGADSHQARAALGKL